eukprot:scaffold15965_cov111-Isochrysis_galbana.AAC.8
MSPVVFVYYSCSLEKPILAFLATGQHGAAELRVGPDGRLPGRAAVSKTAATGVALLQDGNKVALQ